MRPVPLLRAVAGALVAIAVAACGGTKPPAAPAPAPAATEAGPATPAAAPVPPAPPPAPLADFATRKLAVFPLQRIATGDSAAAGASSAPVRARLAVFDSAFTQALDARGLGSQWVLPPATVRAASRDVINRPDARALPVQGLGPQRRPNDLEVREPLASQLRALVAFTDARWVLIPVEARLALAADGRRSAKVRVAILDARSSQVVTLPEIPGPAAADEKAALAAAAVAIADLVATP